MKAIGKDADKEPTYGQTPKQATTRPEQKTEPPTPIPTKEEIAQAIKDGKWPIKPDKKKNVDLSASNGYNKGNGGSNGSNPEAPAAAVVSPRPVRPSGSGEAIRPVSEGAAGVAETPVPAEVLPVTLKLSLSEKKLLRDMGVEPEKATPDQVRMAKNLSAARKGKRGKK
jgi:hypothetical protein